MLMFNSSESRMSFHMLNTAVKMDRAENVSDLSTFIHSFRAE